MKQRTAYPATLFLTGANDPRVNPRPSPKMNARLQSATTSTEPIPLRTRFDTGHGGDTPLKEPIAQAVDVYAFLFRQLGLNFKEPGR